MLLGNFLLMAGGFGWKFAASSSLVWPCRGSMGSHSFAQCQLSLFWTGQCAVMLDPHSSCTQCRDRPWSLGGRSGEKRVSSERKAQSVLHGAPANFAEFMFAQLFIKMNKLMTALIWSSRVKSWKQAYCLFSSLYWKNFGLFLVARMVWSAMYGHETCHLQWVDILLIQHRKGKDDLGIK